MPLPAPRKRSGCGFATSLRVRAGVFSSRPAPFFFSLTSLCPPFPCTLQPYLDIAGLNRAVLGRLEREKNTVREADSLLQARYLLSGAPQVAEQRDAAQPPDDEPEAPQADAAEAD